MAVPEEIARGRRQSPAGRCEEMTKIKNFRISLRAREVGRWLKARHPEHFSAALGDGGIERFSSDSKRWVRPAALYTTLTRAIVQKTLPPLALCAETVAVSVIAVTTGPALE